MGREGGRGIGEGGRDRFRREYPSRYEEETRSYSGSGRFSSKSSSFNKNNAPPSRHLWVGNLAHDLLESELTQHFLHFGDLESVAFHPGRSYAFLNFVSEDDAIDAFKALQGFPVAGNPLRIEFAKAVSLVLLYLLLAIFLLHPYICSLYNIYMCVGISTVIVFPSPHTYAVYARAS